MILGTNIWSAPEIMDDSEIIDCKADIFSFGLIIYETVSLVPPHTLDIVDDENDETNNTAESSKTSDSNDNSCATVVSEDCELERVDRACGTRPPLQQAFDLTDDYNRIIEIFYCCTNELPEDRPTAKIIWSSLENENSDNKNNEEPKSNK